MFLSWKHPARGVMHVSCGQPCPDLPLSAVLVCCMFSACWPCLISPQFGRWTRDLQGPQDPEMA